MSLTDEIRSLYPNFHDADKICCEYSRYFRDLPLEELRSKIINQIEHEIKLSARLRSKALRP